jgi:dTDP-4-dehydrorhamnose reductase
MEKVLVLGADGFLGKRLLLFERLGVYLKGTSRKINENQNLFFLDANDIKSVYNFLKHNKPRIVINCIGCANVDLCEKDSTYVKKINTTLPAELASITSELGIKLVHISTDHYKSKVDKPRTEATEVWAINEYGRSKIEAEEEIKRVNKNALIIRTNFFGHELNGGNLKLLSNIKKSLESETNFTGFSDVYFSPVSIGELIKALFNLIEINASGIINVASNEVISKFEFAKLVARCLQIPESKIISTSISKSNLTSPRPNYLALDNSLYKKLVNLNIKDIDAMIADELSLYPR